MKEEKEISTKKTRASGRRLSLDDSSMPQAWSFQANGKNLPTLATG